MEYPDDRKDFRPRVERFTWNSKQALYEYFENVHHLKKADIDREINNAFNSFKLRKGCPINPGELWQKVGKTVEKRLSAYQAKRFHNNKLNE
jgi:hypothetical protein